MLLSKKNFEQEKEESYVASFNTYKSQPLSPMYGKEIFDW
jgi:hypothetical protein